MNLSIYFQNHRQILILSTSVIWLAYLLTTNNPLTTISEYWHFSILGIMGAIVANSTGAGGGIIFIPFFSAIGLTPVESVGTSILIQCFGMTAGTIAWLTSSKVATTNSPHILGLTSRLIVVGGIFSIIGILTAQHLLITNDPSNFILTFRIFSVLFGIAIIILFLKKHHMSHMNFKINNTDYIFLSLSCFTGGIITAWISVGIGEIIAVFLILRRYPTMVAIALGVTLSSISVLTAAYSQISLLHSVNWEIVLFAAPAAIIGGSFAYLLSEALGPGRLKLFFAIWIIVTGLLM